MPRLSDRYALDLTIELYISHRWERLAVQDISRTGMFISYGAPMALDTPVVVAFVHAGERVLSPGRVTHVLGTEEARLLGRTPVLYDMVTATLMVAGNAPSLEPLQIVPAELGDDAGIVGSAYLAAANVSIIAP